MSTRKCACALTIIFSDDLLTCYAMSHVANLVINVWLASLADSDTFNVATQ